MRQVGCESKVSISIFCQQKAKKYDSNSATSSRITNLELISAFFCKTVWLPTSTFMHKIPPQADSNLQNCQIQQPKCIWCLKPCANASPVPTNGSPVMPQLPFRGTGNPRIADTLISALHLPEPPPSMRSCSLTTGKEEDLPSPAPRVDWVPPTPCSSQHQTNF